MSDITVISKTQHIFVDPASSSVSVVSMGQSGIIGDVTQAQLTAGLAAKLTKVAGESMPIPFTIGTTVFSNSLASGAVDTTNLPFVGSELVVPRHGVIRPLFATITERNAWTSTPGTGQLCYVASDTVLGVVGDSEYIWNGTAWKLYNFPVTTRAIYGDFAIGGATTSRFSAVTTAPTLGTTGFMKYEYAVRGGRLNATIRTNWGTTAGTVGSGSYYWMLPWTLLVPNTYAAVGTAVVYGTSGMLNVGIVRQASGIDAKAYELVIHGQSVPISNTVYAGAAGFSYMFKIEGPLDPAVV